MSQRSDQNPQQSEALRQELLEYIYGCHEDAAAIEARIEGEPEVRALLNEVRGMAALLDDAARMPVAPLTLDLEAKAPSAAGTAVAAPTVERPLFAQPLFRVAASFLMLAVLTGPFVTWMVLDHRAAQVAAENIALVVTGPPAVPDAAGATYHIQTVDAAGVSVPTDVTWTARDQEGLVVATDTIRVEDAGVDLPLTPRLESAAMFEVSLADETFGSVPVATFALGGKQRPPLVHLSMDRQAYRPGEAMFLRAVILDRLTMEPRDGYWAMRITDARDTSMMSLAVRSQDGVAATAWQIPESGGGGTWHFELRDAKNQFTVERLPFVVRRFSAPRLAKTVVLDRETYAAGQKGAAEVTVKAADGALATGAKVDGTVSIDGRTVWSESTTLDDAGRALLHFQLPTEPGTGEARFFARVQHQGIVETKVVPFFIPTTKLDVSLYPEGGDLVAGAPVRVYAEVADARGRPVHAKGRVVDVSTGFAVADFETAHKGRGQFTFSPGSGCRYRLEMVDPVADPVDLPEVKDDAVGLTARAASTAAGAPVSAQVTVPSAGPWIVGLFCRGTLVSHTSLVAAGTHPVDLTPPDHVAGVLRLTVFDRNLKPVAERLVHRESAKGLRVEVTPDFSELTPGAHQRVGVKVTDENGEGVFAVVGVSVHDAGSARSADTRRIGLADRAWLFGDLEADELEKVETFMASDADGLRNVDLLLGTRGWRRFAWADPDAFVAAHGDRARRRLALEGRPQVPVVSDSRSEQAARVARVRAQANTARRVSLIVALVLVIGVSLACVWSSQVAWLRRLGVRRPFLVLTLPTALLGTFVLGLCLLTWTQDGQRMAAPDQGFSSVPTSSVETSDVDGAIAWAYGLDVRELAAGQRDFGLSTVWGADPGGRFDLYFMDASTGLAIPPDDLLSIARFAASYVKDFDVELAADVRAGLFAFETPRLPPIQTFSRSDFSGFFRINGKRGTWGREYAHRRDTTRKEARTDFTETVYWNALLKTDATGAVAFDFDLSDRVGTWNVWADVHGEGRVGQAEATFVTTKPFYLDPKIPLEVTAGDVLLIPVRVATGSAPATVEMSATGTGSLAVTQVAPTKSTRTADVGRFAATIEQGSGRFLVPVEVSDAKVSALAFAGRSGSWKDTVARPVRVVARGFPHRWSSSGRLVDAASVVVPMPEDAVDGSLVVGLKLYPSPLATLTDGMDGMLREPTGCFEQTSSKNYPNVLALRWNESTGEGSPSMSKRARALLAKGYARLAGFEVEGGGFDWYGRAPAHVGLTAYGLMQFTDMARVYDVDADLLARTRTWLLSQRDGKGGFESPARSYSFAGGGAQSILDAYVTQALLVAGEDPLAVKMELDRLAERVATSEDPYELALCAVAMREAGRADVADRARDRLKRFQKPDGSVPGAKSTITSSGARDRVVETTGWAVLAWLGDENDRALVEPAVAWLVKQRRGNGMFGATQATVMTMKATLAYAETQPASAKTGTVTVKVNRRVFRTLTITEGQTSVVRCNDLETVLQSGTNNVVTLEASGGNELPWTLDLRYVSDKPADDPGCPLDLETSLVSAQVEEGKGVALRVTWSNLTKKDLPSPMLVVGLPAGLHADTRVLDALRDGGHFDHWEVRGRDLTFYVRALEAEERRTFDIDLVAAIPGTTTGPASRTWLYYEPDRKRWVDPVTVKVAPIK
ncbi:MAG: hypothetical protein CMJ83_22845 [Planctomycetes bacterium]|nr:hypothetical protein [Planctomycetota bacterium]